MHHASPHYGPKTPILYVMEFAVHLDTPDPGPGGAKVPRPPASSYRGR